MPQESFATGSGLTGNLLTAWTNNISGGVSVTLINDPDQEVFNIDRGWPLEGAISDFGEIDSGAGTLLRGSFVQFNSTSGKFEEATSPDLSAAPPTKIMLALDSSTSNTVTASGKLPVLTTNYAVTTDQIDGGSTVGDFVVGAPVKALSGLISHSVGANDQVIGTVRKTNASLGTVTVEVN